jgi:hypothetical protein
VLLQLRQAMELRCHTPIVLRRPMRGMSAHRAKLPIFGFVRKRTISRNPRRDGAKTNLADIRSPLKRAAEMLLEPFCVVGGSEISARMTINPDWSHVCRKLESKHFSRSNHIRIAARVFARSTCFTIISTGNGPLSRLASAVREQTVPHRG